MSFSKALVALLAGLALVESVKGFEGEGTWYHPGLGSCGARSKDSDFIVALSMPEADGDIHCWQHLKVHYQGRTVDVTVVDSCQGCGKFDIDLSPAAFQALAPLSDGRIEVDWEWAT